MPTSDDEDTPLNFPDDLFILPDMSRPIVDLNLDDIGPELRQMEVDLNARIFGQERAIRHLIRETARCEAGMVQPGKPAGIFMFLGSPGVGKSQLAYEFALRLLSITIEQDAEGNPFEPLTLIDCTELSESVSITDLIGSKKGYVGWGMKAPLRQDNIDNPHFQQLSAKNPEYRERFRKLYEKHQQRLALVNNESLHDTLINKYRLDYQNLVKEFRQFHGGPFKKVILFDEIESAHKTIFELLKSIMNGHPLSLTDGSKTNFENAFIIITSNIGQENLIRIFLEGAGEVTGIGFHSPTQVMDADAVHNKMYHSVLRAAEAFFPPALISRARNNVVVLDPLSSLVSKKIVHGKLSDIQKLFRGARILGKRPMDWQLNVEFTPEFKEFIQANGTHLQYGARPLEQVIERYVEVPLANLKNSRQIMPGDKVLLDVEDWVNPKTGKTEKKLKITRVI